MNYVIIFLIAAISTISLSPLIAGIVPTYLKVVLLLITVLLSLYKIKKGKEVNNILLAIASFVFMIVAYKLLEISTCEWGNTYNQMFFVLSIVFFLFINQNMASTQKKILFAYLFLLMISLIFFNIQLYKTYGGVINKFDQNELEGTQFGGTTFNTVCYIFFTACYFIFLKEKKRLYRLLTVAACALTLLFVFFYGARGTVVLLCLYVLIVLPLGLLIKNRKVLRGILIIIIPTFVIIILESNVIIDILATFLPDRLSDRFNDIKGALDEGVTDNSFSGRYGLYWISIDTFFSSPSSFLFGIGDRRGSMTGLISYRDAGIGGHSEILDHCARFGVMGIVIAVFLFKSLYRYISKQVYFKMNKNLINYILTSIIICAFVKSVLHPNIGCALFVILPLSLMLVKKEKLIQQ